METSNRIRIVIVEDQPICRLGIRSTLEKSTLNQQILAEAATVAEAIEVLEHYGKETDLILLDYMLPDGTGMDVIEAAKRLCPNTKIVIFSGEAGGATVKQLMEAGINGFMSKSINSEEIAIVLSSVMAGHDYNEESTLRIGNDLKDDYETMKTLSTKQIADEMSITPHSVENLKSVVFSKVGVKSTSELILFAFRVGLVS